MFFNFIEIMFIKINIQINTDKYMQKQGNKTELLHLYFDDILVIGRTSISGTCQATSKIQTFLSSPTHLIV